MGDMPRNKRPEEDSLQHNTQSVYVIVVGSKYCSIVTGYCKYSNPYIL
jgi:hypothetical protein